MSEEINYDRRRFLGTAAMTIAAAAVQLPIEGELPSLGHATGWLNSQPLTAAGFWTVGGPPFTPGADSPSAASALILALPVPMPVMITANRFLPCSTMRFKKSSQRIRISGM